MSAPKTTLKINLLPKEEFDETLAGQFLKWALTYGRYIIILTQIVVLGVFFLRFKLDREHVDLKESIQQKQALLSSVKEVEDEVRIIQDRLFQIKTIESKQYVVANVLTFLQDITPTDISYKDIAISEDKFSLIGNGKNLRNLSSLLLYLKQSNRFKEITLDDIQRKLDGTITFKVGVRFLPTVFKT